MEQNDRRARAEAEGVRQRMVEREMTKRGRGR